MKGFRAFIELYRSAIDQKTGVYVVIALALSLLGALCIATAPLQLKALLDHVASDGASAAAILALGVVAPLAGAKLLGEVKWLWLGRAEQQIDSRLAGEILERALRLKMSVIGGVGEGAFAQRFLLGLEASRLLVQLAAVCLLPAVFEIVALTSLAIANAPPPATMMLIVGATLSGAAYQMSAWRVAPLVRRISAARARTAAVAVDAVSNLELIKISNAELAMRERLEAAISQSRRAWVDLYDRRALDMSVAHLVFALCFALSLSWSAEAVARGVMSVGELALVHACFLQLVRPLEALGANLRDGVEYLGRAVDGASLVSGPSEAGMPQGTVHRPGAASAVRFEQVTYNATGRAPLGPLSFDMPAGSFVALVGPSGAGKSTIVRLLLGLIEPSSGRVLIDGTPLDVLGPARVRERATAALQDHRLLDAAVAENVALGRSAARMDQVEMALALAGADTAAWPEGVEKRCGPQGAFLSGGERQRVALARCLLHDGDILVLDEATTGLDAALEADVLQRIRDSRRGRTTLLVTHRLSNVVTADSIIVLDRGVVAAQGSHLELLRTCPAYHRLWGKLSAA